MLLVVQALSGILGAFSGQSRNTIAQRPIIPSAIEPMAHAKDRRTANRLSKQAREERLLAILAQPEVMGFLLTFVGMIASNKITFSDDKEKNAFLQAIGTLVSVALGMGYAGVGDLTGLSVAITAGGGSLIGGLIDLPDMDISASNVPEWLYKLTNPLATIIDPIKWIG